MVDRLRQAGFEIDTRWHAEAILTHDFPDAVSELHAALQGFALPAAELVAGGGGSAPFTRRLARSLEIRNWRKMTFTVEKSINGDARQSESHEVDHVRRFANGSSIALEIEWNNKDPFFDRDLENFKRLHGDGAISVGVIVTRGRSLHDSMRSLIRRFLEQHEIDSLEAMQRWRYTPTTRQRAELDRRMQHPGQPAFRDVLAERFVADKYSESSTHWNKLQERLRRGVGNPCPLLLIGIPDRVVTFDQDGASD